METILDLKYNILASIDAKSCSITELANREFLKNRSMYGIELLVQQLISDNYICERKNILYSNKRNAKKILIKNGYYD